MIEKLLNIIHLHVGCIYRRKNQYVCILLFFFGISRQFCNKIININKSLATLYPTIPETTPLTDIQPTSESYISYILRISHRPIGVELHLSAKKNPRRGAQPNLYKSLRPYILTPTEHKTHNLG